MLSGKLKMEHEFGGKVAKTVPLLPHAKWINGLTTQIGVTLLKICLRFTEISR